MSGEPHSANSCDACTVCCMALRIDEFSKPAGTMCQHCTAKGCGIYETRYDVCRGFMCGWREIPELGDAWRPDRSGVLMVRINIEDMPEEYRTRGNGMHFIILGGEKAILRPGFVEYVSTLVARDVAVFLSADSPKTLINKYLRDQVLAKDTVAVTQMLLHIYKKHLEMRERWNPRPQPWIAMP